MKNSCESHYNKGAQAAMSMPTKEKGVMYLERTDIIVNRETSLPGDFMNMMALEEKSDPLA